MSAGVLLERTGGEAAESKGWGESCDTEQARPLPLLGLHGSAAPRAARQGEQSH